MAEIKRLERALLGPGFADREYGVLATSPDLRLTPRQSSTLGAFILGARGSVTTRPGRFVAFFPLDRTDDRDWALAVAEVAPSSSGALVVFADTIIIPRAYLDAKQWAAHRIYLAVPPGRPPVSGGRVPPHEFDAEAALTKWVITESIAPFPGDSVLFNDEFEKPRPKVHVEVLDELQPFGVCASLWEHIPPDGRRGRSFCTDAALVWSPTDLESASFDLTLAGPRASAPEPGRTQFTFDRFGIVEGRDNSIPWLKPTRLFRSSLQSHSAVARRPDGPQTAPREADALQAFRFELRNFVSRTDRNDHITVLAAAAETAANLQAANALDEAHATALSRAILRDFEESLPADAAAVARAMDLFCGVIGPQLRAPLAMPVRLTLERRALLSLSPRAAAALAQGVIDSQNFTEQAVELVNSEQRPRRDTLAAFAAALVPAVNPGLDARVTLAIVTLNKSGLARPLQRLADAKSDPIVQGVEALSLALIRAGHIPQVADCLEAWALNAGLDQDARDWLKHCFFAVNRAVNKVIGKGARPPYPGRRAEWVRMDAALNSAIDRVKGRVRQQAPAAAPVQKQKVRIDPKLRPQTR